MLLGTAYNTGGPKDEFARGLANYFRVRRGEMLLTDLSPRNQTFLNWFGQFLREIENAKVDLSKRVADWRLDAPLNAVVTIKVPENPFQSDGPTVPLRVTAEALRQLFVEDIWKRCAVAFDRPWTMHVRRSMVGQLISCCSREVRRISGGSKCC